MISPAPGHERISLPKAIGWSIAFLVLTLLTSALTAFGAAVLVTGSYTGAFQWLEGLGPGSMLLQAWVTLISAAFFSWLIGFRRLGLTRYDLRYFGGKQAKSGWVVGVVAGSIAAGSALLISVLAGEAGWIRETGTIGDYMTESLKTVTVLAPAALAEEVVFRGVPLVLLASTVGRGSAIVTISVLFALVHWGNPNATLLGLGNIALAGIFLGLAFYTTGGIWTSFGAHLGWNLLLACLDTPVSGMPFEIPTLEYNPGTPAWLTGGSFGPEGGLAATLALTAAVLAIAPYARMSPR